MPEMKVKQKIGQEQNFKISRFKEKIKRTQPHKHGDYYELIYISGGDGYHWIETRKFLVSSPEVYFMKPGQMHCWQFTSLPQGFVVLFRKELFDPIRESHLLELLNQLSSMVRIPFETHQVPDAIFEELLTEYQNPGSYSEEIIHGYLRALLGRILQLSSHQGMDMAPVNTTYDQFLNQLSLRCPEIHKVRDFARLLNTTPQNLNAVCQKYGSASASDHISRQLLLEAKRYILHTDLSVNEIAEALHFNDSSYFIKFFKKWEGNTPLQFRDRYLS